MKKIFLFLTACLLSTAIGAQTWQIGSPNAGDMTASLNNATLTIQGSGQMQNYNVNTGMAPWFSQKDAITTLIIEEGVTVIGQLAFQHHTSLKDVLLPSSLTGLGSNAFQGCSALAEIIVKSSVPPASLGQYPFTGVNTRNCVLVVPVGSEAAYRANSTWSSFYIVEEGTLPMICLTPTASGKFGIEEAFMWYVCNNTTLALRGEGDMPDFDFPSNDGDPAPFAPWYLRTLRTTTKLIVEEGITGIGSFTVPFSYSLEEIILPNSLEYLHSAFINCHVLKEITLPEGLGVIGFNTFYNCRALAQVTIPSSVYLIGDWVFSDCTGLRSIIIKTPVPPIVVGEYVFRGLDQSLCTLTVPLGSKAAYEAAEVWNLFNIVEGDFTTIHTVENAAKTVLGYYNIMGQKLSQEPESGLYILLYDDGTTEKRLKK